MLPLERLARVSVAPLVLVVACAAPTDAPTGGELIVERTTTEDGTPVVRNVSGSTWGDSARLVEQVVIGGPDETEDEFIFGSPWSVWSTEDRIYVLDSRVPIVRVYDVAGLHLHDIGGRGEGPGEFVNPNGVAVDPAGRVLVSDAPRHLIHVYAPDGSHQETWSWSATGYAVMPRSLIPAADRAWLVTMDFTQRSDLGSFRLGYVPVGPEGAGDTVPQPDVPGRADLPAMPVDGPGGERDFASFIPFAPRPIHAFGPDGTWYLGTGADYRIHVLAPDDSSRIIERYWQPVPVQPDEATAHLRRAEANVRSMADRPEWKWSGPGPASTKPAFTQISPDYSGRIWVERPGAGTPIDGCALEEGIESGGDPPCWTEERYWDVFAGSGELLGTVPVPEGAPMLPLVHIEGARLTFSRPDGQGNPQVVRYRLEIGATDDEPATET